MKKYSRSVRVRIFEQWFPICRAYGMTEEQFWRANPRIIKVYEQAWKDEQQRKNQLLHAWVGNYVLSAIQTGISQVMQPMLCSGKRSNAKYIEEPIRMFPKTEEERQAEYEQMTQAFIAWGDSLIDRYKQKPDT